MDTFTKVSIIPRGMAGGYTLTPPTEDKHYLNKKELMGQMTVLLGGLIAEELHTGDTSTGVSNDLEKVARIARSMVCDYGMSKRMGPLAYGQHEHQRFLGRDLLEHQEYSDDTAKQIDIEVKDLVNECHTQAKTLLTDHREALDKIAQRLIEKEVIDIDEARTFLGMDPADRKLKSILETKSEDSSLDNKNSQSTTS